VCCCWGAEQRPTIRLAMQTTFKIRLGLGPMGCSNWLGRVWQGSGPTKISFRELGACRTSRVSNPTLTSHLSTLKPNAVYFFTMRRERSSYSV
jgi:hypothetical protein